MMLVLLSFGLVLLSFGGMALGLLLGKKPLCGSCGGLAAAGTGPDCHFCENSRGDSALAKPRGIG